MYGKEQYNIVIILQLKINELRKNARVKSIVIPSNILFINAYETKSLQMMTAAMKLKAACSLGKKL